MLELIINVEDMHESIPATCLGLAIAGLHAAFVVGLHVVPLYSSVMATPGSLALQDGEEQTALAYRGKWQDLCEHAGVQSVWEVIRGLYVPVIAKRSCLADFVVTPWPIDSPDAPVGLDDVTKALFSKAAPMLLVPDSWQRTNAPERILIAWNGSPEAARAVKTALPLLRAADTVLLLNGERDGLSGLTPPVLPLRAWLTRQGVEAQWCAFKTKAEIGPSLLEEADAMKADLLVMGAWGRSRLRELVLGGATRHVLEHARIPVLLAH